MITKSTTMPSKSHPGGEGAIGSAIARFFHPSKPIRDKWPDFKKKRLTGVVILGRGERRISRKLVPNAYKVRIPEIEGEEFFIHPSNFRVDTPCPDPTKIFPDEQRNTAPPTAATNVETTTAIADPTRELRISQSNVRQNFEIAGQEEDLAFQGMEVDDDNEPAIENAGPPPPNQTAGRWIKPSICPRRSLNVSNSPGSWRDKSWSELADMDEFSLFRLAFPESFIIEVLIPQTNKNIEGEELTLSEFYVWLGVNFLIGCCEGIVDRRDWWSTDPVTDFKGAPYRMSKYISGNRYDAINAAMRFTDEEAPDFEDKFHEVRKMLLLFNSHYEQNYIPSWLSCLDESMNSWLDKYCPGFMCVRRKPHPFGNEYHTICDGDGGRPILWRAELVEGKDRPKKANGEWAFPCEFERAGISKTAALMLRMTRPIHGKGKLVTMDSGFCVAAGIIEMHKRGVFGQALIKKRGRYWPKYVLAMKSIIFSREKNWVRLCHMSKRLTASNF